MRIFWLLCLVYRESVESIENLNIIRKSPVLDVKQECFDIDIKQEYNPFVTTVTPITAPIKREKSRPPPLNLDYNEFDSFSSQDETSPEAEQEVPNYISR